MGKYYTPPRATISFANSGSSVIKRMTQTVEGTSQVTSDHAIGADKYSGVVRYNIDDWKRYTSVALYPPTISDVNPNIVDPSYPISVAITGTNFVPNSKIYVDDVLVIDTTYISQNVYEFNPPLSTTERGVTITIVRPDCRRGSISDRFFYEKEPVITSLNSDISNFVLNKGQTVLLVSGSFLKPGSSVIFSQDEGANGVISVTSSITTFSDPSHVWMRTPEMPVKPIELVPSADWVGIPATGSFNVRIVSPSSLYSNRDMTVISKYNAPQLVSVLPNEEIVFSTGSVMLELHGHEFLPGVTAYISLSSGDNQAMSMHADVYDPNKVFAWNKPNQPQQTASIYVKNIDGQVSPSASVNYTYIMPIPTIERVSFDSVNLVTTGSALSQLFIVGTAFSGTLSQIKLTDVFVRRSGTAELLDAYPNLATVTAHSVIAFMPASSTLVTNTYYDVIVKNGVGSATASNAIYYREIPTIRSVSNNTGSSVTLMTVNGGTFYSGSTDVLFTNGAWTDSGSDVTVSDEQTSLTVHPPSSYSGSFASVSVYVRNYGTLVSEITSYSKFLYAVAPDMVTQSGQYLAPDSGSVSGRKVNVKISAGNFLGNSLLVGQFATRFFTDAAPSSALAYSVISAPDNIVEINMPASSSGMSALHAANGIIIQGPTFYPIITGSSHTFRYIENPTITVVSSSYAGQPGAPYAFGVSGTLGSITGTNFDVGTTKLHIGNALAESTWVTSGTLTFVTPSIAAGALYDVYIESKGVTSATASQAFRYVVPPGVPTVTPKFVQDVGGARTLTIDGTNFIDETLVILSGSPISGPWFFAGNKNEETASFIVPPTFTRTATKIKVTAPEAITGVYGNITFKLKNIVSGSMINETDSSPNEIRYERAIAIDSFTPLNVSKDSAESYTVTVYGSGFIDAYTVLSVGGVTTSYTYVNSGELTFIPTSPHVLISETIAVSNGNLIATAATNLGFIDLAGPLFNFISPNAGIITTAVTPVTFYVSNGKLDDLLRYHDGFGGNVSESFSLTNWTPVGGGLGTYTGSFNIPYAYGGASTVSSCSLSDSNGIGVQSIERVVIPTINSISPTLTTTSGGGSHTIFGGNFAYSSGALVVRMGTSSLNGYTVDVGSNNFITNVAFPHAPVGQYDISVTNKLTGSATLVYAITVVQIPTITSLSGAANTSLGGVIYISGTNFLTTTYTKIKLGLSGGTPGSEITPTSVTTTAITASIPANSVGPWDVYVINRGLADATAVSLASFTYTQTYTPQITSLSTGTISTLGYNVTASITHGMGGVSGAFEKLTLDGVNMTTIATGSGWITSFIGPHVVGNGNVRVANEYGTGSVVGIEFVSVPTTTTINVYDRPSWASSVHGVRSVASQSGSVVGITGSNFLSTAPTSTFYFGTTKYNPTFSGADPVHSASIILPSGLSIGAIALTASNRDVSQATATFPSAVTIASFDKPRVTSVTPALVAEQAGATTFHIASDRFKDNLNPFPERLIVDGVQQSADSLSWSSNLYANWTYIVPYGGAIKNVGLSNVYGSGTSGSFEIVSNPSSMILSRDFIGSDEAVSMTITGGPFYTPGGNYGQDTTYAYLAYTDLDLTFADSLRDFSQSTDTTSHISLAWSSATLTGSFNLVVYNKRTTHNYASFMIVKSPRSVAKFYADNDAFGGFTYDLQSIPSSNTRDPPYEGKIYISASDATQVSASWNSSPITLSLLTLQFNAQYGYYNASFYAPHLSSGSYTFRTMNTVAGSTVYSTGSQVIVVY